jgi:hypothetical protein
MSTVFISSTSEDLQPYRAAARDAALRAGFRPDMIDYFGAGGKAPPLSKCLAKLTASDVVVVLVAHRYGWKPSEPPGDGSKSVTWLECEHAVNEGKELLAFLVDENHPWPPRQMQFDEPRLAEFRQWLADRRIRELFTTPEDLRGKVGSALHKWLSTHGRNAPPVEGDPAKYLDSLRKETAFIDIRGLCYAGDLSATRLCTFARGTASSSKAGDSRGVTTLVFAAPGT